MKTAEEYWLDSYFNDSMSKQDKKLWLECNNQAQETIEIMIKFTKDHLEEFKEDLIQEIESKMNLYSIHKYILYHSTENIK